MKNTPRKYISMVIPSKLFPALKTIKYTLLPHQTISPPHSEKNIKRHPWYCHNKNTQRSINHSNRLRSLLFWSFIRTLHNWYSSKKTSLILGQMDWEKLKLFLDNQINLKVKLNSTDNIYDAVNLLTTLIQHSAWSSSSPLLLKNHVSSLPFDILRP